MTEKSNRFDPTMKTRKLEIRIRSSRAGVAAEEVTIANDYSEAEARRRFMAILPALNELAQKHLGAPVDRFRVESEYGTKWRLWTGARTLADAEQLAAGIVTRKTRIVEDA